MAKAKSVDEYIENSGDWEKAIKHLRKAALSFKLEEAIKWQYPVYSLNGKNVLGLSAFKNYLGIWFFQGGLLKDKKKKLINAQPGKTKAMLQWRFESEAEVKKELKLIKAYMKESIENTKAGKAIKKAKANSKKLVIPPLLKKAIVKNKKMAAAFEKLSLSKQREYADYIGEAKREATKIKRMDKIIPMISSGIGLHDKYK